MSMTVSQQVMYYSGLLVIQYKTQPNAVATIQALATQVVADQIYSQVLDGFDLETAVGAQLDILAQYVGAPREIFGYDPSIPYFALYDYSVTPPSNVGFASYTDVTDPVDSWLSYTTSETAFVLSDGQLRLLIQYLIALHKSDHTLAGIDLLLQAFFGSYCTLTDNQNMTIQYTHQTSDPNTLFGIVNELNLLPHPAGTAITVVEV
jgi:hypothetical protein